MVSVLVHLLLLYPALNIKPEPEGSDGLDEKVQIEWVEVNEIVQKQENNDSESKELESEEYGVRNTEYEHKKEKDSYDSCDKFYWGIGILINFVYYEGKLVEEIVYVYKGYPAEKSGLRAGDIILETDAPIKSDAPGVVNIVILRSGEKFSLLVYRDKICHD